MKRIIHFEIPSRDPQRAAGFYKNTFGWDISKWEGPEEYWSVVTGPENEPGINGGIEKNTNTGFVCIIDVPDIDEYSEKILANGGTVLKPKKQVMGAGWLAYFKDSEGSVFGIIETNMDK